MHEDAGACACSWLFVSKTQPGQATGQKAKHPGTSSKSTREELALLEAVQAAISLPGAGAPGGAESACLGHYQN